MTGTCQLTQNYGAMRGKLFGHLLCRVPVLLWHHPLTTLRQSAARMRPKNGLAGLTGQLNVSLGTKCQQRILMGNAIGKLA